MTFKPAALEVTQNKLLDLKRQSDEYDVPTGDLRINSLTTEEIKTYTKQFQDNLLSRNELYRQIIKAVCELLDLRELQLADSLTLAKA